MEEADKKEKELIKKEEAFHVRDSKLKDAEMDIELRYKKLEDKERTAAKKRCRVQIKAVRDYGKESDKSKRTVRYERIRTTEKTGSF